VTCDLTDTRAVLFDLDGTLIDTAPDMVAALNALRREEHCGELAFDEVRQLVSNGALGLVRHGFPEADTQEFARLRARFLDIYSQQLAAASRCFEGLLEALERLESGRIPWGIVTNKPGWLTLPLLEKLGLRDRAGVIVCGDTLTERKPHPAPLLHALARLGVTAAQCIYVGDAERDVQAARAAGMKVFVALFGYIPTDERPREWLANGWLADPQALTDLLDSLVALSKGRAAYPR
jgi:N-acetyl-D-muramate 6-phosphate phosphatase